LTSGQRRSPKIELIYKAYGKFGKSLNKQRILARDMTQKVMMIKVRRVKTENINQELQWVGNSLGLFGLRDKDSSCFRVFITLVKKARRNEALTSDNIAEHLKLSRGTVVHHLTKLMETGIVVHEKEGYILREATLQSLVKDIRRDVEVMLEELDLVAKEIDERMG